MRLLRAVPICAAVVTAWDPSQRDCSSLTGSSLCLTSFQWCSWPGTHSGETGCSPPAEGGYLRGSNSNSDASLYALLLATNTYNVSWKKTAGDDYPVRVRWSFRDSAGDKSAKWEINTTETFFMFRPVDVVKDFPTPLAPDWDPQTALAFTGADFFNYIEISQPEHPLAGDKNRDPRDLSQPFTVQDYFIDEFFKNQAAIGRDEESRKWKKGVSIGVGVGVPVLIVSAALIGWSFGKKRGRRVVAKQ